MAYQNRTPSPKGFSSESPYRKFAVSPIPSYKSPVKDEHWEATLKEKMQGYESETSFSDDLSESLNHAKENMFGEDKKAIIQLQSLLKHVDKEKQESYLNELYGAYNDPNSNLQMSDLIQQFEDEFNKKPEAQFEPIKQTHNTVWSTITVDPDPVIATVGIINRECHRSAVISRNGTETGNRSDVSPGAHVPEVIGHRNAIETDITIPDVIPPIGDRSTPKSSSEHKAKAFMVASLVEPFLTRNRDVSTSGEFRDRLFNNGRIPAPDVMKDIRRRNDIRLPVFDNM